MDITVEDDALGTHFDWQHDGVTPRMIDWFWSNMEKGFVLWHPEQHEYLEWPVRPHDSGVAGRSSGIGRRKPEDEEAGRVWAAHAAEEIANWEVFLGWPPPDSRTRSGRSRWRRSSCRTRRRRR